MTRRVRALTTVIAALLLASLVGAAAVVAQTPGQRVFDTAGIWLESTEVAAQAIADRIEERTGAQLLIYSELAREGVTGADARARAAELGNTMGVGREGFDDGFVVLFAIEPNLRHGQVALVAGDGFREAYIPDADGEVILDEAIIPYLVGGQPDYDSALLAGLGRIDQLVTPERAAELTRARQINAILGLVGTPVAFLLLTGKAVLRWRRYGRDPVVVDSDSIHLPAPPPGLTAAAGAVIRDGHTTRRALTAALLDLASRGQIGFVERPKRRQRPVGILTVAAGEPDPVTAAHWARNARRPTSAAEKYALGQLRTLGAKATGELGESELETFGTKTAEFDTKLETHLVDQGWFREAPSAARNRSFGIGGAEIVGAAILFFIGLEIPASGLVLLSIGIGAAGLVTIALAPLMPAVTEDGARVRVMLNAYRRTLDKTMAQARSMDQVVDESGLDWLDTPDQATVWAVALGLGTAVEKVLARSAEDLAKGRTEPGSTWFPGWYISPGGSGSGGSGRSGGSLYSGSAVPNFGSMMAALGTIGNPPPSKGGGSSGGSFGGGGGFSGGSSRGF